MTAQSSPFDVSAAMQICMQSVEFWKKNYENLVKNAKDMQGSYRMNGPSVQPAGPGASTSDAALLEWQQSGGALFKRFVQNQIRLCRFFGNRWEHYLTLPEQLSQCRSLTDLGNLQASFLSQFAKDYMHELEKFAYPVTKLMAKPAEEKKA